jgi:hypothetical protein
LFSLSSDPACSLAIVRWPDFQKMHPDAWIIIEVVAASHSELEAEAPRSLERIRVLEVCHDAESTYRRYRELRRADPSLELCFLHTAWDEELEERWQFSRELGDTVVAMSSS